MQRLYPMFPAAGPGAGLLLLRCWLATTLIATNALPAAPAELRWFVLVTGAAMVLGAFTPIAAAAAFGIALSQMWLNAAWTVTGTGLDVMATSILLLGPGAFSLDGYRYGRRVLT